jgi:Fe-S-cluster containining protein
MAPDRPKPVNLYQQAEQECLSLASRFKFQCRPGLACFNRCCRTPTVLLSPYDILRLRQGLGITSGEFLGRYTLRETDTRSNLPLIFLDAFRSPEDGCPFAGPDGCQVYPHRPAACRLFPITMGSQLTNQGVIDYYFCRRLDYCQGFDTDVEWTVESWQANQGFPEFAQARQGWLEILLKQGLQGPVEVPSQVHALLPIVAYDLDEFRRLLLQPGQLPGCDVPAGQLAGLQTDDLLLLRFSYRYLNSLLFAAGPD